MEAKLTLKSIMNYLRANEDDIADSLECSIEDLPPLFNKLDAAPLLYVACKDLMTAVPIQNAACCGYEDRNCAVMVNALTKAEAAIAAAEKGE